MSTFSPDELAQALEKCPAAFLARFDPAYRRYLRGFTQGTMAKRIAGRPGLMNRTGALRRSFAFVVTGEKSADTYAAMVYTTSPYARIHERGGTVVPRRSQYLTIPLGAARTGAGASRGGARSFTNTFFFKSRAGNLLLAQRQGKKIVPLFVLKKSITVPAGRLGFVNSWEQERDARASLVTRVAAETLDGLKGA